MLYGLPAIEDANTEKGCEQLVAVFCMLIQGYSKWTGRIALYVGMVVVN